MKIRIFTLSYFKKTDIFLINKIKIHTFKCASIERISSVAVGTRAYGIVIYNLAESSNAASPVTRVNTLQTVTSLVQRTLGACGTFWSTSWRISGIPLNA